MFLKFRFTCGFYQKLYQKLNFGSKRRKEKKKKELDHNQRTLKSACFVLGSKIKIMNHCSGCSPDSTVRSANYQEVEVKMGVKTFLPDMTLE